MAGFTQAYQQTLLDYAFPTTAGTDHIAYSVNGTSEFAGLKRTAIGATGWSAATAATPSVKQNGVAITSDAATVGGTVSHFAIFSAATGGTQKIDWTAIATPRTVAAGDQIAWAVGAAKITLD